MLEPLAAKNIVPQTDLLNARREVNDLQGRIDAAREQQSRALAAVREAQAQASEAGFSFRQEALNERSQINAKIAVNRAIAARRAPAAWAGWNCAHRSTASSTTSR